MIVHCDGWRLLVEITLFHPLSLACPEHPEEGGEVGYDIQHVFYDGDCLPDALPSDKQIDCAVYEAVCAEIDNENQRYVEQSA